MLAKMLSAALVTLVAGAPAAMADKVRADSNSYVIALGNVDASNPADVDRVMDAFNEAARKACTLTGTRIANSRCVKRFVADAIAAVKSDDLQVALLHGDSTGGGIPQAASAPNRQ